MLVMVVVVCVSTSPPVLLLILLFLTLGAALHGVRVIVCVDMCVSKQRGRGGQLFQRSMCGFNPDCGFTQQIDGMGQSGQNELKTLLEKTKHKLNFRALSNSNQKH